jgi:hypothetical protein
MTDRARESLTFNLLVMAKGGGHYRRAGQSSVPQEPRPGAEIVFELEGRTIRGLVDQVHVPPGCEEHCIGTVFVHEL